jgi:hypothetical protein
MYPHRIRLRGPWDCEPLARLEFDAHGSAREVDGPLPEKRHMTIPCRWGEGGLGDFSGRVRFRRRFGWLANIAPHERVWLTFGGVDGSAETCVNGCLLGTHGATPAPFEFEVSSLLQPRNELTVVVEAPGGSGGLWGEVALEVRCSAYLRAVRWWMSSTGDRALLHVSGEVVGTADRPLELYGLIDGSTVIYSTLEPTPAGQSFSLTSEPVDALSRPGENSEAAREHAIRIELVNGAVRWYCIEGVVAATQPLPG